MIAANPTANKPKVPPVTIAAFPGLLMMFT
jgi:hypothetical protein